MPVSFQFTENKIKDKYARLVLYEGLNGGVFPLTVDG